MRTNTKELILLGVVFSVIQFLISSGVFVTYQQMTSYAAPKDDINKIEQALIRIENKIDKISLRY